MPQHFLAPRKSLALALAAFDFGHWRIGTLFGHCVLGHWSFAANSTIRIWLRFSRAVIFELFAVKFPVV